MYVHPCPPAYSMDGGKHERSPQLERDKLVLVSPSRYEVMKALKQVQDKAPVYSLGSAGDPRFKNYSAQKGVYGPGPGGFAPNDDLGVNFLEKNLKPGKSLGPDCRKPPLLYGPGPAAYDVIQQSGLQALKAPVFSLHSTDIGEIHKRQANIGPGPAAHAHYTQFQKMTDKFGPVNGTFGNNFDSVNRDKANISPGPAGHNKLISSFGQDNPVANNSGKYGFGSGQREGIVGAQHAHLREQGRVPGVNYNYSSFVQKPKYQSAKKFGTASRPHQGMLNGTYSPGPAAYRVPCAVANVGAQHGDIQANSWKHT